jgi:hypothetical protein
MRLWRLKAPRSSNHSKVENVENDLETLKMCETMNPIEFQRKVPSEPAGKTINSQKTQVSCIRQT